MQTPELKTATLCPLTYTMSYDAFVAVEALMQNTPTETAAIKTQAHKGNVKLTFLFIIELSYFTF
jgi:hypothetical protein